MVRMCRYGVQYKWITEERKKKTTECNTMIYRIMACRMLRHTQALIQRNFRLSQFVVRLGEISVDFQFFYSFFFFCRRHLKFITRRAKKNLFVNKNDQRNCNVFGYVCARACVTMQTQNEQSNFSIENTRNKLIGGGKRKKSVYGRCLWTFFFSFASQTCKSGVNVRPN